MELPSIQNKNTLDPELALSNRQSPKEDENQPIIEKEKATEPDTQNRDIGFYEKNQIIRNDIDVKKTAFEMAELFQKETSLEKDSQDKKTLVKRNLLIKPEIINEQVMPNSKDINHEFPHSQTTGECKTDLTNSLTFDTANIKAECKQIISTIFKSLYEKEEANNEREIKQSIHFKNVFGPTRTILNELISELVVQLKSETDILNSFQIGLKSRLIDFFPEIEKENLTLDQLINRVYGFLETIRERIVSKFGSGHQIFFSKAYQSDLQCLKEQEEELIKFNEITVSVYSPKSSNFKETKESIEKAQLFDFSESDDAICQALHFIIKLNSLLENRPFFGDRKKREISKAMSKLVFNFDEKLDEMLQTRSISFDNSKRSFNVSMENLQVKQFKTNHQKNAANIHEIEELLNEACLNNTNLTREIDKLKAEKTHTDRLIADFEDNLTEKNMRIEELQKLVQATEANSDFLKRNKVELVEKLEKQQKELVKSLEEKERLNTQISTFQEEKERLVTSLKNKENETKIIQHTTLKTDRLNFTSQDPCDGTNTYILEHSINIRGKSQDRNRRLDQTSFDEGGMKASVVANRIEELKGLIAEYKKIRIDCRTEKSSLQKETASFKEEKNEKIREAYERIYELERKLERKNQEVQLLSPVKGNYRLFFNLLLISFLALTIWVSIRIISS